MGDSVGALGETQLDIRVNEVQRKVDWGQVTMWKRTGISSSHMPCFLYYKYCGLTELLNIAVGSPVYTDKETDNNHSWLAKTKNISDETSSHTSEVNNLISYN